jgi:hypothetical protein
MTILGDGTFLEYVAGFDNDNGKKYRIVERVSTLEGDGRRFLTVKDWFIICGPQFGRQRREFV